jgi:hypothetical protein
LDRKKISLASPTARPFTNQRLAAQPKSISKANPLRRHNRRELATQSLRRFGFKKDEDKNKKTGTDRAGEKSDPAKAG